MSKDAVVAFLTKFALICVVPTYGLTVTTGCRICCCILHTTTS